MQKTLRTAALALVLGSTLTGCLYSREISQTRHAFERAYPEAHFERETVVNLGPLSLFTLGLFSGEARAYTRSLRRVKVGVYRAEGLPPLHAGDLAPVRRLRKKGWQTAIHTRAPDEAVWVLYRMRRGAVRDLYVVTLDDEELVLTRLSGRLDAIFARAFKDGTLHLDRLRPE